MTAIRYRSIRALNYCYLKNNMEEMSSVASRIKEISQDKLEKVFAEGESDVHDVGIQIREI